MILPVVPPTVAFATRSAPVAPTSALVRVLLGVCLAALAVGCCPAAEIPTLQVTPVIRPMLAEAVAGSGTLPVRASWLGLLEGMAEWEYQGAKVSADGCLLAAEYAYNGGTGTRGTTHCAGLYDLHDGRFWQLESVLGALVRFGQWSPDGRWISWGHDDCYSEPSVGTADRDGALRVLLDSSRLRALTGCERMFVWGGGWSPDNRHLAWGADGEEAAAGAVGVVDLDGSVPFVLDTKRLSALINRSGNSATRSTWVPLDATWSPRSSRLAVTFSNEAARQAKQLPGASEWGLLVVNAAPDRSLRWRKWRAAGGTCEWSGDGRSLLVSLWDEKASSLALDSRSLKQVRLPAPERPVLVKRRQSLPGQQMSWVWSLVEGERRRDVLEAAENDRVSFAGQDWALVESRADGSLCQVILRTGERRVLHPRAARYLVATSPRFVAWLPCVAAHHYRAAEPLRVVELATGRERLVTLGANATWQSMAWQKNGAQLLLVPGLESRLLLLDFSGE